MKVALLFVVFFVVAALATEFEIKVDVRYLLTTVNVFTEFVRLIFVF